MDCENEGMAQKGLYAHTEGYQTLALGNASHAEGQETQALDNASHAQGRETIAGGKCSHAQGFKTKAVGDYSTAIGCDVEVTGNYSVGIQLNKNNPGVYTRVEEPNTLAIIGGKVGIATVCPEKTLEVAGSVLMCSKSEDMVFETTTGKLHYVKDSTPSEDTEVVVKKNLEMYVTEDELEERVTPHSPAYSTLSAGSYTLGGVDASGKLIDIYNYILSGDVTLSHPVSGGDYDPFDGQKFVLRIRQDSTGTRLLTLGGNFNVPTSIAPLTLTTTANKMDVITVIYDSTRDKWDVVDFKKGF